MLFISDVMGVKYSHYLCFGGISSCQTTNSVKYTTLDFTTAQTVWVVAAAGLGQSHVVINRRMLVVTGCKQNHRNVHFFLDLGTKMIECKCHLTGGLILLGAGLGIEYGYPSHKSSA